MKTSTLFMWVFILAILVGVSLFVLGCDDDTGNVGPSRRAIAIYGDSDNISTGWFVYVDTFNEEIQQEGVAMIVNGGKQAWFYSNNGMGGLNVNPCNYAQHIESTGVTGAGGRCIAKGIRDDWSNPKGYNVFSQMSVGKPDSPATVAGFNYQTQASQQSLQWAAATAYKKCPRVVAAASGLTGNYTQDEFTALTNPTENPPPKGIAYTCNLISQNGTSGNGTCRPMNSIMAINLTDPDDYLKYAAPFYYSFIVRTADPIALDGVIANGFVKTNIAPDGRGLSLSWYGSSTDGQTHVFRTEPFLPVDSELEISNTSEISVYDRWTPFDAPDIWDAEQYLVSVKSNWIDFVDPNLVSDPNVFYGINPDLFDFTNRLDTSHPKFNEVLIPERILSVKVIPLQAEGDYLRISIKDVDLSTIIMAMDYWLTDNRICDLNGDGIVNLRDWPQ